MTQHAAISDRDFAAVQRFVYREIGVSLSDAKKALVVSRLASRLRALEIASYRDYVARAEHDSAERQHFIDSITTNETRFFREQPQFELLRNVTMPSWRAAADEGLRARSTRIWSAGCSSGEEPYSIAMLLQELLPAAEGWSHELMATDISSRVVAKAAAGIYPIARKEEIPLPLLKRFMLRGVGAREGMISVTSEIRNLVRFSSLNLNDAAAYPNGVFDAIFCRNVLIYFDTVSRQRVLDALVARLAPGGMLFLGHAESLSRRGDVRTVIPSVYVKLG